MLDSVWQDIKREYHTGNMVTRIIMVCVALFVAIGLIRVFSQGVSTSDSSAYRWFLDLITVPSTWLGMLKEPWSLITYMFLHEGFWHLLWNMLWFYIFGRIFGDLLGDQRVLPLYLLAGLSGALAFLIYASMVGQPMGHLIGASAAVSGVVIASAVVAPDYMIRLILLGNIPIKYIAVFRIVMDLLSLAGDNAGGSVSHLGGVAFGWIFVWQLRQGTDLTSPLQSLIAKIRNWFSSPTGSRADRRRKAQSRRSMKVVHQKSEPRDKSGKARSAPKDDIQTKMDRILDKINEKGMDGLTQEEKDFLKSFGNT